VVNNFTVTYIQILLRWSTEEDDVDGIRRTHRKEKK
jgi:hypothetical protein